MKVLVNWLPASSAASAAVASAVEQEGFWGLGVTDSPRAVELYTSIETCRAATHRLAVGPCVTNPVTRHASVHAAAFRPGVVPARRCFFGIGSGDSAVKGVGLRPGTADAMVEVVDAVRDASGAEVPAFVAAAGPRAAAAAGRVGGLLGGCGGDLVALDRLASEAERSRPARGRSVARWVSLRFAVAGDASETAALRRAFLPRALSAARFNLHPAAGVPDELLPVLADRFDAYDYGHHGSTGPNPNGELFADRPDIEEWALERFALIGDVDACAAGLAALAAAGVDGCFLSVRFEDAIDQIARAGRALRAAGLADDQIDQIDEEDL